MRTNKALGVAAVLALIVAIGSAGIALAQTRRYAMGAGRGPYRFIALNYVAKQLDLTDQQKQQIKDIVRGHKDDIKALIDQGFAARKALRQGIAAGSNDQISAAVGQLSGVQLKGAQLRAQIRAKVFSEVLQPDQRAKADQLLGQWEQKADHRRQRIDQFLSQMQP